jgi:maltose O-acetyltransferase
VVKDLAPQLPLHGFQYTIARSTVCPRLSTPTSLDVFLAGRHADARHRLSQTRNTFCDNAVCTLDTVDSPDALMNGFHALVALHQDRWNRLGFPGLFFHARCVQFHREVAQRFFERGWLWFKIMRLEDAPIAARMGFVFNNCIYDYLSGFDDQSPAARRRPGLALLLGMIEDAIRWRCTAVDLLRGDESYKFDLTSEVDYNWSVGLFNSDTCRTLRVRLYRLLSRGNAIVHRIAKEWLLFRVSQRAYGFPGCLARYSEFRLHRLARKMRHSMAEPFHRRLATTGRALKQRLLTGIDTMRYPVLHRIIRGLERDYELPLTWKIRKGLVFLRSMLLAKLYLRKCQEVGHRARTRGKPYIDNIGQIHIGDDFHLNSRIVRSELATGHKGCIKIGDEVTINFGASICAQKLVKIGNRVRIGPYATIMDSDFHALDERDSRPSGIPTVIEDDVWLAGRVTVLKGTRIGRGTVITAGSVVSGIIPPGVIAGGVPARVIRSVKQPEEPKPSRKAATDKSRQVDETQVVERVTAVITEMFGVDGEIDSSWGPGNIVSWDSLGHLNLMSRLEKMFNVTFSDDDMVRMTTIQGICDTIVRCVARSLRPDRTGGEEVLAEHPRHRQP